MAAIGSGKTEAVERALAAAREAYRHQPSTVNVAACERLYLELCQLQAEEENWRLTGEARRDELGNGKH